MARSLSPVQHGELEDLMKNSESQRVSIIALKSYVKDLDSNTLPAFVARVCDPDKSCSFSEEGTLCLFEIIARVHGRSIVPHISSMVSTIIRIMSSGSGSFLHNVECSNVVCAISRYGVDPLAPDEEKKRIISSLCHPLSDCLMSMQESIASGSALCLIALAESNNWQFASGELVNEVCLKVSGALEERHSQTDAHLGLVIALSKRNPLILEPYGRSLIRSGLQILVDSSTESNYQMMLSSIQMIGSLMRSLDSRNISSELSSIVDIMEQCQDDCLPDISSAAFEALKTAKIIARQKTCGHENCLSPVINYNGKHSRRESHGLRDNVDIRGSGSSESLSYELQSVHSFLDLDTATDSPPSLGQCSYSFGSGRAKQRLLSNGFDASHAMPNDNFLHIAESDGHDCLVVVGQSNRTDVLSKVAEPCAVCITTKATNQCTQISRQRALSDDSKMQFTPQKHLHSCAFCEESKRNGCRSRQSPSFREIQSCSAKAQCRDDYLLEVDYEIEERNSYRNLIQHNDHWHIQNGELLTEGSMSPMDDGHHDRPCKTSCEACQAENNKTTMGGKKRNACSFAAPIFIFGACVVLIAIFLSTWWKEDGKELYAVPT